MSPSERFGKQVVFDGVVPATVWREVDSEEGIENVLLKAAKAGNATPLESRLIRLPVPYLSKPGSPSGGTAWVGLDESHITLHWYDELPWIRFALDVFTCGERADIDSIINHVLDRLPGCEGKLKTLERF